MFNFFMRSTLNLLPNYYWVNISSFITELVNHDLGSIVFEMAISDKISAESRQSLSYSIYDRHGQFRQVDTQTVGIYDLDEAFYRFFDIVSVYTSFACFKIVEMCSCQNIFKYLRIKFVISRYNKHHKKQLKLNIQHVRMSIQ